MENITGIKEAGEPDVHQNAERFEIRTAYYCACHEAREKWMMH